MGEAGAHVLIGTSGLAALAMMLRAMQLVRFEVPQCDRQTHKRWLGQFSMPTAVGMWGAHIGLAVTTVIAYGGLYPVLLLAAGLSNGHGEWLPVVFWLGRTAAMWLAPVVVGSTNGSDYVDALMESRPTFRHVAAIGLAMLASGAGVYVVSYLTQT
ncbi:MAG: hypothetical protein OXG82_00715 [Gammaproteobacteria bacterium]|nr:hypothetical protein [Gammaproteobacteria bacterium]